jgi:hypothetical protein
MPFPPQEMQVGIAPMRQPLSKAIRIATTLHPEEQVPAGKVELAQDSVMVFQGW